MRNSMDDGTLTVATTQADLARELKVATSTVQRALVNSRLISEEMKHKVWNLARERGYKFNVMAGGIKGSKSHLVGVVMHHNSPNMAELCNGLNAVVGERGYCMVQLLSGGDPKRERANIRLLLDRSVDAVAIVHPCDSDAKELDVIRRRYRLPVVVFRTDLYDIEKTRTPFVAETPRASICELLERLIARGHRRIAFTNAHVTGKEHIADYCAVLKAHNIDVDYSLIGNADFNGSPMTLKLVEKWLSSACPPTAILTASEYIAAQVFQVAYRYGFHIPNDLSVASAVCGYLAPHLTPTLTGMQSSHRHLGECMGEKLLKMLEYGYDCHLDMSIINSQFIERESVKDLL